MNIEVLVARLSKRAIRFRFGLFTECMGYLNVYAKNPLGGGTLCLWGLEKISCSAASRMV